MSLKAKVKVGRVTNLSEARYCAGMGVDMLGFPVGEEGLKPEHYKQMIEWVAGPEFVLEVHHFQTADVKYITDNYPGHYIEIGSAQLGWLSDKGLNFVVAIKPHEWVNLYGDLTARQNIKYVELLGATKQDSATIRAIGAYFPVLLNVESTEGLDDLLKLAAGIALTGSDEEKPGIKDYSKVSEILEALETD